MNRKTPFANGEYYHIYNRGVDKRTVFLDDNDYRHFLLAIKELNQIDPVGSLYEKIGNEARPQLGKIKSKPEKIVEVISYCLNPNHYHLILKQLEEKGIEKFMQRLGTSHAMYFNKKYKRSGTLFQGPFKSIHIDSNEYLIYLSAYVNKNNFIHGYTADDSWKYSSLNDFLGKSKNEFVNVNPVLSQFRNIKDYEKYLNKNASHFKSKKEMEDNLDNLEARPPWRPRLQEK